MRTVFVLIAPLLLPACHKQERGKRATDDTAHDSAPTHDTGPATEPDCDTGILDDDGDCVPAACGSGTWGDLELDEGTVYVDIAAAEGGDGSDTAPFTSIQAGLDAAGDAGGGMVAVAAGSYPEALALDRGHDGVRLAGRCWELVIIDASAGGEGTPGIDFDARSCEAEISGVTVSGARDVGLFVGAGSLTFRDSRVASGDYIGIMAYQSGMSATALAVESCEISENTYAGVVSYESGTRVDLRQTTIQDTQLEAGEHGYGVIAIDGATLSAEDCQICGNHSVGLMAYDATVNLRETTIQGTEPDEYGAHGYGVEAKGGAVLAAESCEISENTAFGVLAYEAGTSVSLRETAVLDTRSGQAGDSGFGIAIYEGASLEAEDCTVSGNTATGIVAADTGTAVALRGTSVQDTLPTESGELGYGVAAMDGAVVELEGCQVSGNTAVGAGAGYAGSSLTLRDTTITDTRPSRHGQTGNGIELFDAASLTATNCEVSQSTGAGIVVEGDSATVTLQDTSITSTRPGERYTVGVGIAVQGAATVEATGVELSSNEGPGLYVAVEGSHLRCSQCILQDNQFAGAVVAVEASLELHESLIEGTTEQECLGGGVGIYAAPWLVGPPTLSLTATTIQDNPIAGVWLSGAGSYSFLENTIRGGTGWTRSSLTKCGDAIYAGAGVAAWDGAAGLLLEGNELLDGRGAGLFLDDATATLSGNTYSDNAVDLVMQGADCATPPEGYDDEALASVELCPTYDYATCRDEFRLYLELAKPESGHGVTFTRPALPEPALRHLPPLPVNRASTSTPPP